MKYTAEFIRDIGLALIEGANAIEDLEILRDEHKQLEAAYNELLTASVKHSNDVSTNVISMLLLGTDKKYLGTIVPDSPKG
jgi:hypothetical protein